MWGEVTRELEGEPWQGGAQSQRRGSDTAEVSNDSPGIVLLNYELCMCKLLTLDITSTTATLQTTPYSSLGLQTFLFELNATSLRKLKI